MRIAKKATKGKGKRWKQGDSSSCNPDTKKFREKSKASVVKCDTKSKFTVDAIEAHNVLMLNKCSIGDTDTKSEAESFASLWSNCTNPSFDKLLNNWQSTSMLHKEMLAVLAAVTEIIKEKGGKETEIEYFATLMTTLEGIDNEEAFTATVCLINMVVRRLPSTILKCKFSESAEVFRKYISEYANSENGTLMRCLISSLAFFLRAQEIAVWKMTSTQQLYQEILSLTTHQKPRVRKAANKAVVAILKGSTIVVTGQVYEHPAASLTAKFCVKMIEETRLNDSISVALQMLNLMKDIMTLLPAADVKSCCETILRMMTLGNAIVITTAFKIFHTFFLTQANNEALHCDLNAKLIMALYDHQPSVNDSQPLCAWLVVMKQAHICLFLKNREQFLRFIPKLVKCVTACWLSDSQPVYTSVEDCLEGVITVCLRELVSQISINSMREIFSLLEKCLSYQYIAAWSSLFHIFGLLFEVFGPEYPEAFKSILKNLAELRESYDFKLIADLDTAIGSAVKHMGPEVVLAAIPLSLDLDTLNLNRSWLLPVLRDNIQEANLNLFSSLFISYSKQIEYKIEELNKRGDISQSKVCEVLNDQIWSLLPSFCNKPKDLTESFKVIARNLGHVLRSSELRTYVLKALRILIASNMDNDANKAELSSYAKNFLPILLRLYTSKDNLCTKDVRLSILETVRVYLSISDKETVNEQYKNLMNNLEKLDKSENPDELRKHVLLDVLRIFIPFIDDIEPTFRERVIPLINNETDKKCQKKGYQIIEAIVKTNNDSILDQCLELLISSFPRVADSAKFAPLRSLKYIIENGLISDEKRNVLLRESGLKEAINALSIISTKTRTAALELIVTVSRCSQSPSVVVDILLEKYLRHKNVDTQNSAIQALTKILVEFSDVMENDEKTKLFKCVLGCLNTMNRSVVQSVLLFIKSWLRSVPKDKAFSFVVIVIDSLNSMSEENQRHFRFKIKEILTALIRKFGFEPISKFVPEKYSKVLKSIRKLEARKNKEKSHEDEDDSSIIRHKKLNTIEDILEDSSDDEVMGEHEKSIKESARKRTRLNTYIAEDQEDGDVLDLLGTNASKKILSTEPQKKKNISSNIDFEVADDGRLVIEDFDDKRGIKRKSMGDSEDEEETEEGGNIETEKPKYQPGGKGIHRDVNATKKPEMVRHNLGEEYRSNKAKGDMKRKGRPDPYAYVPLNPQALNKRKTNKFRGQFKNIVRAAKKGAEKGSKSNIKMKRHSKMNKRHK